ncbi:hypothetical protein FMEAI12_3380033 [Parafrankia sp. Ea1.12]|nr:hypothetical protein FMEAI12_3380033 [Parafrankia sp. Ea1.12]
MRATEEMAGRMREPRAFDKIRSLRYFPFLVFPITIVATILGGNSTGTAPAEEEPWSRLRDVDLPRGQRREVM